ncbi:MAG TPA: SAM-dependent methyltransferase [Streptosporangiaceae bacterium]
MHPSRASVRSRPVFDPSVAHPARVYNYWLGGKDHYLADRAVADEVARWHPHVVAGARANRAFLARAVRYLAGDCGIRQFLDIGTGLPAPGSTHELAQQVAPECAVAYADNDPLVLVHARALLTSRPEGRCGYIDADLRDPPAILAQASATLDFAQPVAVLLLAILHFLAAADDPAGIVAALARALAPGSYLVISNLTADFAPDQVGSAVEAYNAAVPGGVTARSHAEVTALFGGLPLVPPGVVPVTQWRPAAPVSPAAPDADLYAGIARTPPRSCASTTRLGVLIG